MSIKLFFSWLIISVFVWAELDGQNFQVPHRSPANWEIPVTTAGYYDIPGASYILVNDISSPRSTIFLGKDVSLDLNGYTISYSDGNYEHVPNFGFEDGIAGWDFSKAPGAKIENAGAVHAFIGKKILRLKAGDEIASGYILLPVAGRSYYAIAGVTGNYYNDMRGDLKNDMRISIYVDDEKGNEVRCVIQYGDSTLTGCPVINRSARLGGGFVFAHLNNLPAGKYRVRVRAENDCLVDEIDIRPAMDVGIGIVDKTHPLGHYDHLYNNLHAAFFDYTSDVLTGRPLKGIPVNKGFGNIIIKNGIIKNATEAVLSWGIQSTAQNVKIVLDNIKIISSGINTTAVDVEQATITNCIFDINNPFIINRHGSEFYGIDLRGDQASEVSFCQFYGGQGCLSFKGRNSSVHHNLFVNRQTVTNHYSIMAMGDGSRIFENRFEPEIGSGIEIFRRKYIEIFNNEFHIKAAPPSCEYADHLSTNAIRIADYGAKPGDPEGCFGNRIYNNVFYISGKKYEQYPDFIPMASAFFYSTSAGDNEIFGNQIFIDQADPESDAEAFAFYIGNSMGGHLYNNKIVSNVTPVWIASAYGNAENAIIRGNTFISSGNSRSDIVPVKMGSVNHAYGAEFRSNIMKGMEFRIDASKKVHKYQVYWTAKINLENKAGSPYGGAEIIIKDRSGNEIFRRNTDKDGIIIAELPEYFVNNDSITYFSPYTIITGKTKTLLDLKQNTELKIVKTK